MTLLLANNSAYKFCCNETHWNNFIKSKNYNFIKPKNYNFIKPKNYNFIIVNLQQGFLPIKYFLFKRIFLNFRQQLREI